MLNYRGTMKAVVERFKPKVVHVIGGDKLKEGSEDLAFDGVQVTVIGPAMNDGPNRKLYHDWYKGEAPDLALLFHPGLWGYDDWHPTLTILLNCQCHIVVTSYTIEEARLDFKAIRNVLSGRQSAADDDASSSDDDEPSLSGHPRWCWGPELNPYGATELRPTATAPPGHEYRENSAWQCIGPPPPSL